MIFVNSSMSDEDIVAEINAGISGRTQYGRRDESGPGKRPWRRVAWSNNQAEWWQYYDSEKGIRNLDANEIGICGISRTRLEPLLSQLDSLPLYGGSFERRTMGTPDYIGTELPPFIKYIRDTDSPREDSVDEALGRKASEN